MQVLQIAIVLIFCIAAQRCTSNANETINNFPNGFKKDSIKLINLAYFQYHGVRSLNLIECPSNKTGSKKGTLQKINSYNSKIIKFSALKVSKLASFFMENSMPMRIWSGRDYLPEMPKRALFGPPITFREVRNDTFRRPLKFKLELLNHKTGIILNDFNSACGLNVLRWSAATENNYFKTNNFWLLVAKDLNDLRALQDEDIFLPPDSEVKVLVGDQAAAYSLLDVYKVAALKPLKYNFVAKSFSSVKDMFKALSEYGSVISLREDLEGIRFNTGRVINFPDMFTGIEDLSLRHIDTMAKVTNRLVVDMARKLNLRYMDISYSPLKFDFLYSPIDSIPIKLTTMAGIGPMDLSTA